MLVNKIWVLGLALVLVAPVSAQDGSADDDSSSGSGSSGSDEEAQRWCQENPNKCRELWQKCHEADDPERFEKCRQEYCERDPSHDACKRDSACEDVRTFEEAEKCRAWYCNEHPHECDAGDADDGDDARGGGHNASANRTAGGPNGTGNQSRATNATVNQTIDAKPSLRACERAEGKKPFFLDACARIDAHRRAAAEMDWLDYNVSSDGLGMENVSIRGQLVFTRVHYQPGADGAPFIVIDESNHRALARFADGAAIILNDQSRSFLVFRGTGEGDLTLEVPRGATVSGGDSAHSLITYASGHRVNVAGSDVDVDGRVLETDEFVSLTLQGPQETKPPTKATADRALVVQQAIERSHVAAEVKVRLPTQAAPQAGTGAGSDDAAGDGQHDGVEVFVYDDVDLEVEMPSTVPTPDEPLQITVGAELDEGRTIVIDLDQEVFLGQELELRYYDVNDDGTQTEIIFRQAASITDILDPTNDEGQPEWWLVEDENGMQLMASIPHWSVHRITVASLGAVVQEHSVIVGLGIGITVSVMASAALFRPRRPDEGF